MDPPQSPADLPLATIPVGLAVVALLAWLGYLRRDALDRGPSRAVGLTLADLLIGIGVLLTCQFAAGFAIQIAFPEVARAIRDDRATPGQQVALTWVGLGLTLLPPVAWFAWRASRAPRGLWKVGFLPRRPVREVGVAVLALLAAFPIVAGVLTLAHAVGLLVGYPPPLVAHDLLETMISPAATPAVRASLALGVIFVGPALEEAFYRGLMQSPLVEAFGKRRRWSVVLGVSGIFAVMHATATPPHALPGLFVLGVVLGWLYERTGSLWPPILVHAAFNAANVAVTLAVLDPGA